MTDTVAAGVGGGARRDGAGNLTAGQSGTSRAKTRWPEARIARLRELREANKSTAAIAHGLRSTRSAVKAAVKKYLHGTVPIDRRVAQSPEHRASLHLTAPVDDSASVRADRAAATLGCEALHKATLALFDRHAKRTRYERAVIAVWLHGSLDAAGVGA